MADGDFHVTIHNQTNPDVATTFLMAPEVLWRRLELAVPAGQEARAAGNGIAAGTRGGAVTTPHRPSPTRGEPEWTESLL